MDGVNCKFFLKFISPSISWLVKSWRRFGSGQRYEKAQDTHKTVNGVHAWLSIQPTKGMLIYFKSKSKNFLKVRVVSPVITGGYVQGGGALCMELLTQKGWCSTYTIEKIILQITTTIVSVSQFFQKTTELTAITEFIETYRNFHIGPRTDKRLKRRQKILLKTSSRTSLQANWETTWS